MAPHFTQITNEFKTSERTVPFPHFMQKTDNEGTAQAQ